jgi:hypothetical protein
MQPARQVLAVACRCATQRWLGYCEELVMSQHGKPCSKQVTCAGMLTLWAAAMVLLHAATAASSVRGDMQGCH